MRLNFLHPVIFANFCLIYITKKMKRERDDTDRLSMRYGTGDTEVPPGVPP